MNSQSGTRANRMTEGLAEIRQVTIFTDGACIGNHGPGGYRVVLRYGKHRRELSGGFRLTTNNRMEMMAAIVGLAVLKEKCAVTIYSGLQLPVDSISEGWVCESREMGWKRENERLLNADLWKRLLELCDQNEIQLIWVKGHSGEPQNERQHALSEHAACGDDLAIDRAYEEGRT